MRRATKPNRLHPLLILFLTVRVLAGPVDDLQPGYWYEAPSSRLDSVAYSPQPPGVEGVAAVIDDWNGGAYDSVNDRLIAWGGGHSGYAGNEIYVFELSTMKWKRWNAPSSNVSCNFSLNEYPDGRPCSMHTYDWVDFHPGSQSFVLLGGASPYPQGGGGSPTPHMYSFGDSTWRRGTARDTGESTLTGATSAYDPTRDVFWLLPAYNNKFAKFDPDANGGSGQWTNYSTDNIEIDAASAIDSTRDLFVTVDGRGNHNVRVHDLKNPGAAPVFVTTTGDDAPERQGQIGFEFDPVSQQFVAWLGGDGGTSRTSVYTLEPPASNWQSNPWVWTEVRADAGNTVTPSAGNPNGTYSRWRYVPSKNVFIVVNNTNENVFFYKLSAGGGGPPAPTVNLGANPTTLESGGSTQLTWSSTNATSCTASGDWSGNKALNGNQTFSNLTASKAYTLSCTGDGGTGSDSVSVTVNPGDGGGDPDEDWDARSHGPNVVFAFGFDDQADTLAGVLPDSRAQYATWSSQQHASGAGSLQFEVPSNSGANTSGNWRTNFSPDNSVKFGANQTFYVQWRQRFSSPFLNTVYQILNGSSGGWKQGVVGEGDYPGDLLEVGSCSTLELVMQNTNQRHFPQSYHSCGFYWPYQEQFNYEGNTYFKLQNAIDAGAGVSPIENRYVLYPFEPNNVTQLRPGSPAMPYYADEWMTFQMRISPGPLGTAVDSVSGTTQSGFTNSTLEIWVARQGQPAVKTHSFNGLVFRRDAGAQDTAEKYGKVWFTPYHTDKDPNQAHPVGYIWYDELIVSTSRIPDPSGSGGDPFPVVNLDATPSQVVVGGSSTLSWSSTDATSCTASGDWSGNRAVSGSQVMSNLTTDKHYVLTCTGPGGSGSDSADVDVSAAPAPTVTLTANPTHVDSGDDSTLNWSSTNATSCTASGNWSGTKALSGSLTISNITADKHYVLTCTGTGGSASDSADVSLDDPAPTVTLSANPTHVDEGDDSTLTWSSTDATSCTASGDWSGNKALNGSQVMSNIQADKHYVLTCTGSGGSDNDGADVTVNDAEPTVTLTANPGNVDKGDSSTLTWSSAHATTCTASGDWSGNKALNGSQVMSNIQADKHYVLTCIGENGEDSDGANVTVRDTPPTVTLSANPTHVDYDGSSTLTWSSTNATSCTASGNWSGSKSLSGSLTINNIQADKHYVLTCTGSGGEADDDASVDVGQAPPVVNLTATPDEVDFGDSTTLRWTTTDADVCVASGDWSGVKPTNGSQNIGPLEADSSYSLTCFGDGGRVTDVATVAVGDGPPQHPTITLKADPSAVDYLGRTTLTWTSTNADTCTASGAWTGSKPLQGSERVGPLSQDSVFTLKCRGDGGDATRSITVDVAPPPQPPELDFSVSPQIVPKGASATLRWTATNADGCTASGGWNGARPVRGSASTGPVRVDTTYTLRCTGNGGSITRSATVEVRDDPLPAPEVTFQASDDHIGYGEKTVLSWHAAYAEWCTASGAWSGVKGADGHETTRALTADSTFALSCFNESGRTNAYVTVDVAPSDQPQPAITFTTDLYWVDQQGTPTLTWSATDADTCQASLAWNGDRPLNGNEMTAPLTESSMFELACNGAGGDADSILSIAVGPPADEPWLELSVSPSMVDYGGETQIAWSAANVDECVASGDWSGTRPIGGGELVQDLIVNSTYVLSCTGPMGAIERTITVAVGEPAVPTVALTADPDSVVYGGTSVLSWTAQNVDVCVASGGWTGERTANGIESVGPVTVPTAYVLECAGSGGSVSATANVDVQPLSDEDTDGDGMSDAWEQYYFGDLSHDGSADPDEDTLSDAEEYAASTNPMNWDTDGDGASDNEELYYGSSPIDALDVWTDHRPEQPEVDTSQTLPLLGGAIQTVAPFMDPDGDALDYSQWQLSTDDDFAELTFDRVVERATALDLPAGVLERSVAYWVRTRQYDSYGLPSEWSEARQIETADAYPNDADGDDIDDNYQVVGFADTNEDGVEDSEQGMCNLYDAEGRNVIGFGVSDGEIHCYTSFPNGEIPDGNLYADALQYGMFAFAIDGLPVNPDAPATVQVSVYLPEAAPTLSGWYKFDEANGAVTDYSAYSSVHDGHLVLSLVDGGTGDQDGVVNGVIIDPSGPAIAAVPPPPPPDDDDNGSGSGGNDPPAGGDSGGGGGGGAVGPLVLLVLVRSVLRRRARV